MNCYKINYDSDDKGHHDFGVLHSILNILHGPPNIAYFYTDEHDPLKVINSFVSFASHLFGIRKSMGEIVILEKAEDVDLDEKFQGREATHYLTFSGDEYLFDGKFDSEEGAWKIFANGDWCTCKTRGKPEKACKLHEFYADVEYHTISPSSSSLETAP